MFHTARRARESAKRADCSLSYIRNVWKATTPLGFVTEMTGDEVGRVRVVKTPVDSPAVLPHTDRRTMLWRDVWWLRNRPRLGRVEVLGADRRTGIHLHYDRVAFKRAAELVVDYSGFGPPPDRHV